VVTDATTMAASAKTVADTYPAIDYAIRQLQGAGDEHALFTGPVSAKIEEKLPSSTRTSPPTVSLAAPRVGMISLPAIASSPKASDGRRYAASALAGISSLLRRHHPCGWIVDLRGDAGGDMWPMLLGVGPILGRGRLIAFTGKNRAPVWVSYSDNTISGAGDTARAPNRVPDIRPAPPVAVLTGPNTLSAGEAVAIAFAGRSQTRSFGETTGGATNSPGLYRLADGATIRFSSYWDTDRQGRTYRRAFTPDVVVPAEFGRGDRQARVATNWLSATRACTSAQ
jgi:carboxyl-terminal processing protease